MQLARIFPLALVMAAACSTDEQTHVAPSVSEAQDLAEYDFPSSKDKKWLIEPEVRRESLQRDLERFLRSQGPSAYNNATQLLWSSIATILDAEGRWELAPKVTLDGPAASATLGTFQLRHVIQLQDRIYRLRPEEFPEYEAVVTARGDVFMGEVRPLVMSPELKASVETRARQAIELMASVDQDQSPARERAADPK